MTAFTPENRRLRANHRRGAKWESALLAWCKDRGVFATRPRLAGRDDLGDIHLHINDLHTVLEAKDCATWSVGAWWDEAETERRHAAAHHAAVVIRRRGSTDPGRAWCLLPLEQFVELLRKATPE